MLHRNIDARLRRAGARAPALSTGARRLLTVSLTSATLSKLHPKLHRKMAADARARPCREDIVVGIDSIIIMLIVGAIAGWLAGQIVRGFGFGLLWNIVIGIVGAFIGVWLLTQLGFVPFAGFVGSVVNATIGAVILLVIVGFIKR